MKSASVFLPREIHTLLRFREMGWTELSETDRWRPSSLCFLEDFSPVFLLFLALHSRVWKETGRVAEGEGNKRHTQVEVGPKDVHLEPKNDFNSRTREKWEQETSNPGKGPSCKYMHVLCNNKLLEEEKDNILQEK